MNNMDRLLTKLKKTENPSHHPASPEIPTKLSTNQDESKKKVARTSITPSKAKTVITINRHAIIDLLKEIAENTSVINQLSFKVVNQILSADDDTLSKVNSLQQISLYSDYIQKFKELLLLIDIKPKQNKSPEQTIKQNYRQSKSPTKLPRSHIKAEIYSEIKSDSKSTKLKQDQSSEHRTTARFNKDAKQNDEQKCYRTESQVKKKGNDMMNPKTPANQTASPNEKSSPKRIKEFNKKKSNAQSKEKIDTILNMSSILQKNDSKLNNLIVNLIVSPIMSNQSLFDQKEVQNQDQPILIEVEQVKKKKRRSRNERA